MPSIDWQLILQFVEILVSPQIIAAGMFLFVLLKFGHRFGQLATVLEKRFAKDTLTANTPAGSLKIEQPETDPRDNNKEIKDANIGKLETSEDIKSLKDALQSQNTISRLWEYRYLNYFLVRQTQTVLDWFSNIGIPTVSTEVFNAVMLNLIPDQVSRQAILDALKHHYLIQGEDNSLSITDKGREYIGWRGPLPPIPENSHS